ncbi:hypothetical protein ADEAN_000054300 [Angomonas deanei]|uniref:Uncharacterized protein n=1 Tax=Angomonas deanei TaxID=59799 RepID=A0A7G2C314_9TRYP|nr:hypothetical protein ADEAN_000054300 [Angomonas deanei]
MAGDKKGFVHLYKCELGEALDPNGAVARCRKSGQVKLFTASVGIIALSEDGESALVVSRSGEYHTLQVADYDSGETSDKTSSVMFSFPRRLPFDVSNVWHYSSGLVVTQFGEEVSVYGKGQASPLCRLYAFKGVRAPRLITCTVSNNELRFSFCNDGKTIESVFYPLDKQDYLGVTCVVHGGCGSGKDANTIVYSPHKKVKW